MTTHYHIQHYKTNTFFKATYRAGKFKRLEHVKGKLSQKILDHIGIVIPLFEKDIESYKQRWAGMVNYQQQKAKPKSIYSQFSAAWFTFYEKRTGFSPKFTGADGRHLKQIITYLKSISKDEAEALATWQALLSNWQTLDAFHQKNTDLKYINSQLNKILQNAKEQANSNPANSYHSKVAAGFRFK